MEPPGQRRRLRRLVRDARPDALFCPVGATGYVTEFLQAGDDRCPTVLETSARTAVERGRAAGRDVPVVADRDDPPALIQYTSGSTGQPKGVAVGTGNLRANLEAIRQLLRLTAEDRGVIWLPPYHDMGLGGASWPRCTSGSPSAT